MPDGQITQLTAQLLEQAQFEHRHLDDTTAARFLDRYIDSLDPSHELFLQSDIAEFHGFVPQLSEADALIIDRQGKVVTGHQGYADAADFEADIKPLQQSETTFVRCVIDLAILPGHLPPKT